MTTKMTIFKLIQLEKNLDVKIFKEFENAQNMSLELLFELVKMALGTDDNDKVNEYFTEHGIEGATELVVSGLQDCGFLPKTKANTKTNK